MKLSKFLNSKYSSLLKKYDVDEIRDVIKKLNIDSKLVKQFIEGLKVELEHGSIDKNTNVTNDNLLMTGKIALAHINELPDYYSRLKKMELNENISLMKILTELKDIPNVLYHFTYCSALLGIIKSNTLHGKNLEDKNLSISFTRDINFWKRSISGFSASRKAAFIIIDAKKLKSDNIPMKDYVFKGMKNYDYSLEDEVRVLQNTLKINKYLIGIGLTKYFYREILFAIELIDICIKNKIKIMKLFSEKDLLKIKDKIDKRYLPELNELLKKIE